MPRLVLALSTVPCAGLCAVLALVTVPAIAQAQHQGRTAGMSHDSAMAARAAKGAQEPSVTGTPSATNPSDTAQVARLRALGFLGILSLGDHHRVHHLGIADGSMRNAHQH